MRIEALRLDSFSPFADQTLIFPPLSDGATEGEVQILTGENGTGKTRLLCILAAACGNDSDLGNRMGKPSGSTNAKLLASAGGKSWYWSWHPRVCVILNNANSDVKYLETALNQRMIADKRNSLTQVSANEPPRAALAFRGTGRANDAKVIAMQTVNFGNPHEHLSFEPATNEDALVCQSMANLKMGAAMEYLSKGPPEAARSLKIVERLEGTISRVTGREFSFNVTPHPEVRLLVHWGGVAMRISQLPDGLRSIIGWLVSCIAKLESQFPDNSDPLDIPLLLLLDEPESHLHPKWQRKLIPAAQTLFPHSQIFVATHSPFVISSVNSGWIHILRANKAGIVEADKPLPCSEGDSYLDVVEDILGVKEWYDPETEQLLADFRTARDEVLNGDGDVDELRAKAEAIAKRSDSLRELMAREMAQANRLVAQGAANE